MARDMPPVPGQGPTTDPSSSGQRAPSYPTDPPGRSRTWLAVVLAAIATVIAVVALIVALTRSTSSPAATTAPTYTPAETAAAHQKLCEAYKLAAHAVQIETNGTNQAFAGIATVNGAVMLEEAVNAAPGIAPSERAAALALAEAYSNVAATSSLAGGQDPAWQSALNDANSKDAAMKAICGGG
jgi:hypothetical protein